MNADKGRLWIVATPIGNLGDFSQRARETLAQVALVAAEDTRHSAPLIAQCEPSAPCMVVVGGAHLLGPDSVVALLTRAGFTVEQQ